MVTIHGSILNTFASQVIIEHSYIGAGQIMKVIDPPKSLQNLNQCPKMLYGSFRTVFSLISPPNDKINERIRFRAIFQENVQ